LYNIADGLAMSQKLVDLAGLVLPSLLLPLLLLLLLPSLVLACTGRSTIVACSLA